MDDQPTLDDLKQLRGLLEAFANGEDRSINMARQIEGHIATAFPPKAAIQDLADSFAQSRPGGGDFLFSETDMLPQVAVWLKRVNESSL